MADATKIEWADMTFNPWRGCQKVSPGCDNCYAEAITKRFGQGAWGPGAERQKQRAGYWEKPFTWDTKALQDEVRRRVFCGSMIDVFDNAAPPYEREKLWFTILGTPFLDWLLLTKRPENIAKMLPNSWGDGFHNVWLGISAEDQERYNHRWPILAEIPAKVRFVSYEPALEPMTIEGQQSVPDWMICGGESGPRARPMLSMWVHRMKRACERHSVPFFFKQWGTYTNNPLNHDGKGKERDPSTNGKGGALLFGELWREFPKVVK